MRILLTGSDGYIGCLLAATLLQDGHDVTGIDTGFYRSGWLYHGVDRLAQTTDADVRRLGPSDLEGYDAVVHLGELCNDPIGDRIGSVTYDVNHHGSVHLATLARDAGVERFVYMSSCSVYGIAGDIVDESSPTDPQTDYAKCKVLVERDVTVLADDAFSPTFLRNATAFGASPRMRFDIVLNNLAGWAYTTGKVAMTSDGSPWRPLVHALDIGNAIRRVLEAPRELIHAQVFNVGSNEQNYRVREIAEEVGRVFEGSTVTFGEADSDNRSYRVDFTKIHQELPGFACEWDLQKGARQLYDVYRAIDLDEATFTGRPHVRLKQIEYLLKTGQLDESLFWAPVASPS